MEQEIIKSYKINFYNKSKNNWRIITKSKQEIINKFLIKNKQLTNFKYKELYNKPKRFSNYDKDHKSKIRNKYEQYFQNFHNIKSWHAQNINKSADDKFNKTLKSFYWYIKKNWKSDKLKMKKPYSNDILEFNLDDRMLKSWSKDLIKDENINNLYWLSILNPFKSNKNKLANWYKNNINIPILLYPEIIEKIEKWYKYSFSLWKDYIKINFKINLNYLIKENNDLLKNNKKLDKIIDKIAIDFWKYTSTYDSNWEINQYDLSNMYNKINNIKLEISELQSELKILFNKKEFWNEYNVLKNKIVKLNKRIKEIIRHSYNFIANQILKDNPKKVVIEDLNFVAIKKKKSIQNDNKENNKDDKIKNEKYKGKKFNSMINIMSRWIWENILANKIMLVGNHLEKINAKYSSQCCYNCWNINKKNRKWKEFHCLSCWYRNNADINAAMNIFHSRHILA